MRKMTDEEILKTIDENFCNMDHLKDFFKSGAFDLDDVLYVDGECSTVLGLVAYMGRVDVAKILIEAGAGVNIPTNDDGLTPLMSACLRPDNSEMIKFLVDSGAHIEQRDLYKETILYSCAGNNWIEYVKLLVKLGANIEAKCSDGYTPLMIAISRQHESVVRFLINSGADVNSYSKGFKCSCLSMAVKVENVKIAKMLLNAGADVNARDNDGLTPCATAAILKNKELVDVLINAGADLSIQDNNGISVREYINGRRDTGKMIEDIVCSVAKGFFGTINAGLSILDKIGKY